VEKRMPKDFLSAEDQAKVSEAAGKDLETVEGTPTEPEGGPAPTPDAADTAGTTPGEETAGEETVAADAEPKPGQRVPYDRFSQVVTQKNEAQERVRLMEERLAREVELGAKSRAQAILEDIARRRPELAPEIYGPDSEQAKAAKPEPLPEDPVQRKLALLEREANESRAYREKQAHMEMVKSMEDRAEAAMENYPILSKNERIQALAETAIVQRILAKPQVPVEKVVEEVASDFRHFEESIKAEYKQAKVEAVKKVPAGVGSGGAAPPGAARKKFSLERPGELAKAFANAMNQGEQP
jgi:hypothetical protein